jgi:hypothetical protein
MSLSDFRFKPWSFRACGWLGIRNDEREDMALASLREMRGPLTDYELGFNDGVEASAYEAWRGCRHDLYVRESGLEQKIPSRIRRLKLVVK